MAGLHLRASRLRLACEEHQCAILAAGGVDAGFHPESLAVLTYLFGAPTPASAEEAPSAAGAKFSDLVLLLTPSSLRLYCGAAAWDELRTLLELLPSPLSLEAYVPSPSASEEEQAELKLHATREMLALTASEGLRLAYGTAAHAAWPLLLAASAAAPPPAHHARALEALGECTCACDASALRRGGALAQGERALHGAWAHLAAKLDQLEAYDRLGLSAAALSRALVEPPSGAPPPANLPPPPPPPSGGAAADGAPFDGVWAGAATAAAVRAPADQKAALHSAGSGRSRAIHAIGRASSAGGVLSCARTLFFSNGRVPHHWQHRVFSDGEVFDPLVEDEVPEVDRADETCRLMQLYCLLVAGADDIVAAAAAAAPKRLPAADATALLHAQLAKAVTAGLLPEGAPLAEAELRVRLLDGRACGDTVPSHWGVHTVSCRLDGAPAVGGFPEEKGALLFEDSFALDEEGAVVRLCGAVPRLLCWAADGAEESEARQVCAAVDGNLVCADLRAPIERLRAGEHHVLQTLCAPAERGAVLLTDSPWLPLVHGELRLFSGGIAFHCERHGPLLLPFRIHLAAAASVELESGRTLVLLRQKPDTHAYGPLAHLPRRAGGELPDIESLKEGTARPHALALALVLNPDTPLHRHVTEIVWPIWKQLFTECNIACDVLTAPPKEFHAALFTLQTEEIGFVQPPSSVGMRE